MNNWPKQQLCPKCQAQAKRIAKYDGKSLQAAAYRCRCGVAFELKRSK